MKQYISRILRRNQTPWERKLWHELRNRNILNTKFRRQCTIGKYIVDFCCVSRKIIIELDGGQHNEPVNIFQDKERQKYLESHGYRVLRFWNNEIDDNLNGVIGKISDVVTSPPPPLR